MLTWTMCFACPSVVRVLVRSFVRPSLCGTSIRTRVSRLRGTLMCFSVSLRVATYWWDVCIHIYLLLRQPICGEALAALVRENLGVILPKAAADKLGLNTQQHKLSTLRKTYATRGAISRRTKVRSKSPKLFSVAGSVGRGGQRVGSAANTDNHAQRLDGIALSLALVVFHVCRGVLQLEAGAADLQSGAGVVDKIEFSPLYVGSLASGLLFLVMCLLRRICTLILWVVWPPSCALCNVAWSKGAIELWSTFCVVGRYVHKAQRLSYCVQAVHKRVLAQDVMLQQRVEAAIDQQRANRRKVELLSRQLAQMRDNLRHSDALKQQQQQQRQPTGQSGGRDKPAGS